MVDLEQRGSTLIFWQWPLGEQQRAARDGMAPYILGPLPQYMRASRKPKPEMFELILPKLQKFMNRGYVHPAAGNVYSLIDKFAVPKADDIRVVLIMVRAVGSTMWCGLLISGCLLQTLQQIF
eukprot:scaffold7702_cov33-Attheya_sp.AAC.2